MKKEKLTMVALTGLVVALGASLTSCYVSGDDTVSIDTAKTQLFVKYTNGGLRREWLDHVVANFEEDYKNHSFETGKTGIQIVPDYSKLDIQADAIPQNQNQVFLMESADYLNFKSKNCLADITDVVTSGAEQGDGKEKETATIESKMRDDSRTFYNLGTTTAPKYYGIPFYESSCTLNYNAKLFENRGFYFAKGQSADSLTEEDRGKLSKISSLFVSKTQTAKSAGPDGVEGTYDDGLPATYADFEVLITYITASGSIPFVWNGYEKGYLTSLILGAWANAVGAEQMKLSLSWDGTAKKILQLNEDYSPKTDANGNYLFDADTALTADNAYLLHHQKGCYDAIRFAKMIVANSTNYYEKSFSSAFSHTTAQEYFIKGKEKGYIKQDIAMLNEGTWWNSEANGVYTSDTDRKSYSFGVLPYPHPSKEQIGEKQVILSDRNSMIFVNANCSNAILPVAKCFASYVNSDRSMNTFSQYTDMVRALKYSLTADTKAAMSPYGNNVYAHFMANTTDHVEWEPLSQLCARNSSTIGYRRWGFAISTNIDNPIDYLGSNPKVSALDYYKNINAYFTKNWTGMVNK
jgi:hypothetical protein